jgi:hypothetical protein
LHDRGVSRVSYTRHDRTDPRHRRGPRRARGVPHFEAFYEAEARTLFQRLWLVTGNRAEAEELMQDAFLSVWERWERVGAMDDPVAGQPGTFLDSIWSIGVDGSDARQIVVGTYTGVLRPV